MVRRLGLLSCTAAVVLLGVALLTGREAFSQAAVAATAAPAAAQPSVAAAWVRLPVVQGRPAAGYFTLHGGAAEDRLVAVTTPAAGRVELHSMNMTDGVMRMAKLDAVTVPPETAVMFAPGGNHLMMFDLKPGLRVGQRVPLAFRFASGRTVTVDAELRDAINRSTPGTGAQPR